MVLPQHGGRLIPRPSLAGHTTIEAADNGRLGFRSRDTKRGGKDKHPRLYRGSYGVWGWSQAMAEALSWTASSRILLTWGGRPHVPGNRDPVGMNGGPTLLCLGYGGDKNRTRTSCSSFSIWSELVMTVRGQVTRSGPYQFSDQLGLRHCGGKKSFGGPAVPGPGAGLLGHNHNPPWVRRDLGRKMGYTTTMQTGRVTAQASQGRTDRPQLEGLPNSLSEVFGIKFRLCKSGSARVGG